MKRSEFVEELELILDVDEGILEGFSHLKDAEGWNSIGMLNIIALFDSKLGLSIQVSALRECNTLEDLVFLAEGKID